MDRFIFTTPEVLRERILSAMEKLTVEYRHGKKEFRYKGATRAQVEQVLKMIQADLLPVAGRYTWAIIGEPGSYKIVALDEKGQIFSEAFGKSPGKALQNFPAAKKILKEKYGIAE